MNYTCKKQFAGKVSVRSYIVEYCQKMKEPLTLLFDGKSMKIKNLKSYTCDNIPFVAQMSDKYIKKGAIYRLYDYEFSPDPEIVQDYTDLGLKRKFEAMKEALFGKKKETQMSIDK